MLLALALAVASQYPMPQPVEFGADGPAIARLFSIRPIKGAAYKPAPSDYTGGNGIYNDSDFCNDDFRQLWGPSNRDDLQKLRSANVNFLNIYDWNQPGSGRNHKAFLDRCQRLGIYVSVPISNYYVGQVAANNPAVPGWMDAFVREIYPGRSRHRAVVMWKVGNEFQGSGLTADQIAATVQAIVAAEDRAGISAGMRVAITSPVAFTPDFGNSVEGAGATLQLRAAFQRAGLATVWNQRFVASANSFNPAPDLRQWVMTRFPGAVGMQLPFMFFELGKEIGNDVKTEVAQGNFVLAQLNALVPLSRNRRYLGQCVFSYVNEAWKGGTEATFGMYAIDTPNAQRGTTTKKQSYPIDKLRAKPLFTAMAQAYR